MGGDRTDSLVEEERDQKVSVGLGGVPPWAFRHRSLLKTSLGSSPMPQLPVLPAGPSKPPENKIAAVGSKKKAPLEPQQYPLPGGEFHLSGLLREEEKNKSTDV